ncbi:MAG: DUF3108 domain-containing protein [Limnohabitans sp.]|nr:DUF3108 domain-containing protein [Limnohabitans sp.]
MRGPKKEIQNSIHSIILTPFKFYPNPRWRHIVWLSLGVWILHLIVLQNISLWGTDEETPFKTMVVMQSTQATGPTPKTIDTPKPRKKTIPPPAPVVPNNAPSSPEPIPAQATSPSTPSLAPPPEEVLIAPTEKKESTEPTQPKPIAIPYAIPGSTRMRYEVSGTVRNLNYTASGELLWQHDGQKYNARYEVSAFLLGSRSQTSVGQISAQGLMPSRFGDKNRNELAVDFDREKALIVYSANSTPSTLMEGAQDRLSVLIQLGARLAGDTNTQIAGSTIQMPVVSTRESETWLFVVDGEEKIDLPYQSLKTLKVTRTPRRDYDQKIEVWLSPQLAMMPVRFKLTQSNGDFVDQKLRSVSMP